MFWIFTFFGNSDSAVHPHPYINFFILSLTLSLSSHLFPSPLLSLHFPHPPTYLLYSPYFYSNILPHSTHTPHPILSTPSPYTHPSLIHSLSTAFPQVIHNPYLINRPFIYPIIPTYIAIPPIIPIIIPTILPSKVIHRYTKLSTSYPQAGILIHRLSTDISILSYV